MTERVLRSSCWVGSVKCGSFVSVRDGRVVKIWGNSKHTHSEGAFCVKGVNALFAALDHPDRPLYSLRRVKPEETENTAPVVAGRENYSRLRFPISQ